MSQVCYTLRDTIWVTTVLNISVYCWCYSIVHDYPPPTPVKKHNVSRLRHSPLQLIHTRKHDYKKKRQYNKTFCISMNHSWLSTADGLKKLLLFLFPDPKHDTDDSGRRNGNKMAAARISHTVIQAFAIIVYTSDQVIKNIGIYWTLTSITKHSCVRRIPSRIQWILPAQHNPLQNWLTMNRTWTCQGSLLFC